MSSHCPPGPLALLLSGTGYNLRHCELVKRGSSGQNAVL